jgi:hypothetical protein
MYAYIYYNNKEMFRMNVILFMDQILLCSQ